MANTRADDYPKCVICKKANADIYYTVPWGKIFTCRFCDDKITELAEGQFAYQTCTDSPLLKALC